MYRSLKLASFLALSSVLSLSVPAKSADDLTIGSKAPELNIEHWVQKGRDRFSPVTKFQKDKVYVVEFWATWCGPCRMSMPHLAETQEKYLDKGVQIISISDEDLETVQEFLASKVPPPRGSKAPVEGSKTYAELTAPYCLTTDPDGSSSKDYLEAASQNGIPAAFIVGKTQQIEWIGHPMAMDVPLQKVVDGTWNRDEFAAQFKEEQALNKLMAKFSGLMQKGDSVQALQMLDEHLTTVKNPETIAQLQSIRFQVIMQDKKLAEKLPEAVKQAFASSNGVPEVVNNIAWTLYEGIASGTLKDKSLLKLALAESEASVSKASADFKASMMDTIAHLHHELGDKKKALEIQQAAIKIATAEEKENLQAFLDQLLEEAKSAKK